jgi:hypothetical protein
LNILLLRVELAAVLTTAAAAVLVVFVLRLDLLLLLEQLLQLRLALVALGGLGMVLLGRLLLTEMTRHLAL